MSAAVRPRTIAARPAQAKIPALNRRPLSRTARYSQKSARSSDCLSASDNVQLSQVLGEELSASLRARRGEHLVGVAVLFDRAVVEEEHPVRNLRERHLMRDDDHRRARLYELPHDVQDLVRELGVERRG